MSDPISTREAVIDAIETALRAATPAIPIVHWRDIKNEREHQINIKDPSSSFVPKNEMHEHTVLVVIESLVVGTPAVRLGKAMNREIARLLSVLGDDSMFDGIDAEVVRQPLRTESDTTRAGHEMGHVEISMAYTFQTEAWSPT